MPSPVSTQIVDGTGKGEVRITIVYGTLFLCSIGVNRVAMAEPVGIVLPHYWPPLARVEDFKLNSESNNSSSTPEVPAAKAS
jgi:hypothetical protein